ncbi:MAG: cysteine desulfurase [candidate division WOR-3 bacterium]|uniref:Cysteine desulfurase n=2 Tax=candidate division WOR-3 bacterium TaxID=2052148 RepID=A0A7C3EYY6_UNCW3|nr:cysteine desulfurase [candidate division WOR-3 bacterium]
MVMKSVYFDHANSTPVLPEAIAAMHPYLNRHFGNPSSLHRFGDPPRQAIEQARNQVSRLINAAPESIIFTSSATESNNLALKGLAFAHQNRGRHIIVSAIEHISILEQTRTLKRSGFDVTTLKVDQWGRVDPQKLRETIRPDTILVSVMHANYEIGTIQPVEQLAAICRERGVLFHSDGTAAVGRIPVDVTRLEVDAYTFSAQSVYGPKGAAVLYLKPGIRINPLIEGGFQEKGRRAGTENVAAIAGMGRAAEITGEHLSGWRENMNRLSRRLYQELPARVERIIFTGHPIDRLPGVVSMCIEFVEGEALLLSLDDAGIAAASGSACTARTLKASHVLLALGIDHAVAQSSLLLTLGKDNTDEDIDYFLDRLPSIVSRLRSISPLYARYLRGENPYACKTGQNHQHEEN